MQSSLLDLAASNASCEQQKVNCECSSMCAIQRSKIAARRFMPTPTVPLTILMFAFDSPHFLTYEWVLKWVCQNSFDALSCASDQVCHWALICLVRYCCVWFSSRHTYHSTQRGRMHSTTLLNEQVWTTEFQCVLQCDLTILALSDQANHNARTTNSDDAIVFSMLDYIVFDVCGVEIRCCFTEL